MAAKKKSATPTPPRVGPMNSLRGVRREVTRVYRAAARGELDPSVASKLTYIARTVGDLIEAETFEERLERLEDRFET